MARNVFFSFHYQDVIDFRANVVRQSGKFRKGGTDTFRDASIWEEAEEKKVKTLKELIDKELVGKGITCVLIGSETYSRRWVRYELMKSFEMKKGIFGVGINWIRGRDKKIKIIPGENPFDYLKIVITKDGKYIELFEKINSSWVSFRDKPVIKNIHFNEKDYGKSYKLSDLYKTYSYDWDNGYVHFSKWIEVAAVQAGR